MLPMISGHRLSRLSIALLAWSLAGLCGAQSMGRFAAPVSGAVLEAGATVRIAWDLPKVGSAGFDEMELVLSLDGGLTFPIRVTRDLDPAAGSVSFRVPALPARNARLALRAGGGGEPGEETILLVSEPFAIEVGARAPLESTARVSGEWRTGDALERNGGTQPFDPIGLAADPSTIESLPSMPPAAPRTDLALSLCRPGGVCPEEPARASTPASGPAPSRAPTSSPLRV
jgi:hypothetical protein